MSEKIEGFDQVVDGLDLVFAAASHLKDVDGELERLDRLLMLFESDVADGEAFKCSALAF